MTVTIDHTPTTAARGSSPPAPAARLRLKPADTAPGLLDGAWWPRSRDLVRELPALIDALDRRGGRITRIAVNPTLWPVVPRKVTATGHVVHVGWFTEQDPHKVLLLSYTTIRWDLLVIPPQSDDAGAARLMAAATGPRRLLTASGLVANEESSGATETGRGREAEHAKREDSSMRDAGGG
jgi:hypothetical protein